MPSQKLGVEMTHSANTLDSVPHTVPRPTAEAMPAGTPMTSAIVIAIVAS